MARADLEGPAARGCLAVLDIRPRGLWRTGHRQLALEEIHRGGARRLLRHLGAGADLPVALAVALADPLDDQ